MILCFKGVNLPSTNRKKLICREQIGIW